MRKVQSQDTKLAERRCWEYVNNSNSKEVIYLLFFAILAKFIKN